MQTCACLCSAARTQKTGAVATCCATILRTMDEEERITLFPSSRGFFKMRVNVARMCVGVSYLLQQCTWVAHGTQFSLPMSLIRATSFALLCPALALVHHSREVLVSHHHRVQGNLLARGKNFEASPEGEAARYAVRTNPCRICNLNICACMYTRLLKCANLHTYTYEYMYIYI